MFLLFHNVETALLAATDAACAPLNKVKRKRRRRTDDHDDDDDDDDDGNDDYGLRRERATKRAKGNFYTDAAAKL